MKIPIQSSDRKRLITLGLCLFALFSLLLLAFFKIQIIEGEKWTTEGNRQHYFIVNEPFLRGTFVSNTAIKQGHPEVPQSFVVDLQKFHLYVDPESIPEKNRQEMVDHLEAVLKLNRREREQLLAQFEKKSRRRQIAMWLDPESKQMILNWWLPYARQHRIARNALFFVTDYQRSYPFGKLLGQVLHTIQNNKDEATAQAVPTGGLELYFNSYLKGKQGKRRLMRSPRNSLETGEILSLPQNGATIHLTINHCLQAIAEEELAKGVQKCKAKSGWAVMMAPETGEILALAQYPFFHLSNYANYFNDPELIEHTKVKAITDANEPGSVMKPISVAVGLLANATLRNRGEPPLFDPEEIVPTSNHQFAGRSKPLHDTHFHAYLNMDMAIQKSSNVYMARLIEKVINRLGVNWYRSVLQKVFGFGLKTGIELPSESPGVLPKPGKKHPNGTFEWSASTPYSLAMGHNIQITTLQLLRAYAVLINGRLVQPTLIRKITKENEQGNIDTLRDHTLTSRMQSFPIVYPKELAERVIRSMKFTTKPGGTARRGDVWGYTEAGKTGTADKIVNGKYTPQKVCSTFVGIAPLSAPAFILAVCMDEPEYGYAVGVGRLHHGGTCSAPVFRDIARRSLEYLGIAPDDPFGYPIGDPRYHPEKADWMPETRRLKEMYEKWNNNAEKKVANSR